MVPAQQNWCEQNEQQDATITERGPIRRRGQQIADPHRQRDTNGVNDQRPDEGGRIITIHGLVKSLAKIIDLRSFNLIPKAWARPEG